jgi:pyruvate formate lyase activating enzyme
VAAFLASDEVPLKEASYYQLIDNDIIQCLLCPQLCKLKKNRFGICGVRQHIDGKLYSLVYGKAIAVHVDPIEKKPLFHVSPGSHSFSIATVGCNLKCKFCQNCEISQVSKSIDASKLGTELSPKEIVTLARRNKCLSISYTYTEPTIYFEYALDCCKLARQGNLLNVFVTNGYINPEPLTEVAAYLDAANVDLKSFQDRFYHEMTGAKLAPVLDTLKLMKAKKIWVEVTTLLIPNKNDSVPELKDIANFIKQELGEETPWHISRFYPQYKLTSSPPTSVKSLTQAREIGLAAGLRYVYTGNIPGDKGEHTYCYNCGKVILQRTGFSVFDNHVKDSCCEYCQAKIDGLNLG